MKTQPIKPEINSEELLSLQIDFLFERLINYKQVSKMSWTQLDEYKKSVPPEEFDAEVDMLVDPKLHSSKYPHINNYKIIKS